MTVIHYKKGCLFEQQLWLSTILSCVSFRLREPVCHSCRTGDACGSLQLVDLSVGSAGPNITLHDSLNTPQLSGELHLILGAQTALQYMCSSCSLTKDQCQLSETLTGVKSEYSHTSEAFVFSSYKSRFSRDRLPVKLEAKNFCPSVFPRYLSVFTRSALSVICLQNLLSRLSSSCSNHKVPGPFSDHVKANWTQL